MINTKRVVPVTVVDLLSLYATVFAVTMGENAPEKLESTAMETFNVVTNNKVYLANEPLKTLNFASTATAGTVYFIPAFDYDGFALNGTATTTAGADVDAVGYSLYKAVLSSGTVTITKFA